MKTKNYIGKDATHSISFVDSPVQYDGRHQGLKEWKPETGAARYNGGFASPTNAAKWLKTMLGKAGWPNATQWEIRPATEIPASWEKDQTPRSVFRVYMVTTPKEKPAPSVEGNLRAILALCDNPHFTSDRKYRIAELAAEAIAILSK